MARVLIVDDDEADRLFERTVLAEEGHDLFFAKSGEEAVRLYLRQRIDVVVTDLQMPSGDGMELITAISAINPDVAIVAVSGKGIGHLKFAESLGARSTLSKPVDPRKLLDAVAEAARSVHPDSGTGNP